MPAASARAIMIVAVDGKTPADRRPDTLADMLRGVEGTQVAVSVRNREGNAAAFAADPPPRRNSQRRANQNSRSANLASAISS